MCIKDVDEVFMGVLFMYFMFEIIIVVDLLGIDVFD